ncbi:hypothetical protein EW026_g212 [Hermanssonia centrifuga]|nr:hypothetical protein EW026_g212 [Hermanssonia centrifuga]
MPPSREDGIEATDGERRLIELDGRRVGPIDRGVCTNLLEDAARFVKENYMKQTKSMEFSMIALAPPVDY